MVKSETLNCSGKGDDGKAKSREAKLGCIFTQTGVDKDEYAVRDENSTTYVGSIENAEEFGKRIHGEAIDRGIERAAKICLLGDAAAWIWNIAQEQFLPKAWLRHASTPNSRPISRTRTLCQRFRRHEGPLGVSILDMALPLECGKIVFWQER